MDKGRNKERGERGMEKGSGREEGLEERNYKGGGEEW